MHPHHLIPAGLLLCAAAAAQAFTISQPVGGDNFGARSTGQTFTPGVGVSPATSLPALPLTGITLYAGNSGAASPSAQTYLNIYDGDPNAGGSFVASSTNALDTNGLTFHTPLAWTFAGVPLLTTTEYWAIMSSTNAAGGLDVEVSLETEPRNGPPGPNIYTGGAGLTGNIVQHQNSVDTRFGIDFFVGVAGSFQISGTGCPSSAGLATMSAQGVPQLGQPFQVDFANLSPNGVAFAVLGFSDTTWNGLPLPVALSSIVPGAAAACQIYISPDDAISLNRTGTTATLTLPMPSGASQAGFPFFLQPAQFDPAGLSVGDKASAILGN